MAAQPAQPYQNIPCNHLFLYALDSTGKEGTPATDSEIAQHRMASCPGSNDDVSYQRS
jgi:hypothetical protein